MTTTYTNNKQYALQGTGDNSNTWGSTLNTNCFTLIDTNLGGRLSLSLSATTTTLTSTQAQNLYYTFTGTLTANSTVYFPATAGGSYIIYNNTSGSYTLTIAPTGGTGVVVPQGYTDTIFVNPDTVTAVSTKTSATSLTVSGTITSNGTMYANGGISSTSLAATSGITASNAGGSYVLRATQAGQQQAYFGSTGSNPSTIVIDNAAGGNSDVVSFLDAGSLKWQLAKNADNTFSLLDNVGSATFIKATTSGALTLGSAQNVSIFGNNIVQMTCTNSGNLLETSNVSGTATYLAAIFFTGGAFSTQVGSIAVSATATSYNTSSDKRLKNNVQAIGNSGTIIDALSPVTYNWQYLDGTPSGVGFLAQDLYAILPEAVTVGDNGSVDGNGKVQKQWSVDNSKLVPYLVAEIQSLRARISVLEKK